MEKKFNIYELKQNRSTLISADMIIIPEWILSSISELCEREVEYCGQLVCCNQIVEYPFIAGTGTAGHVRPEKALLINKKGYSTIEFHTHPRIVGDHYADNFSSGDRETFKARIQQEGDHYAHMLFTTKNVLTFGKYSAPDVRIGFGNLEAVVENFNNWNERHGCWKPYVLPDSFKK